MEGRRLVSEAHSAGLVPEAVFYTAEFAADPRGRQLLEQLATSGVRFRRLKPRELAELAQTEHPQGILAVVPWQPVSPAAVLAGADPLLVVADGIRDPGNLGVLWRTADAAGAAGLACTPGTVDPANPKTLRAGMGAAFHVPLAQLAPGWTAWLRRQGVRVVATAPGGTLAPEAADLTGPCALVFGNEGEGLAPQVLAAADAVVGIPMPGRAESLNVAGAAAILLYVAVRQRQSPS
ncbi:MAG: RNA methyltransferase [Thermaerobacter sp.]|nr:RNA methyltransferase [Thermaerobacter sp.]